MKQDLQFYRDHLQELTIYGILPDEACTIVARSRRNDCAQISTTENTILTKIKKKDPTVYRLLDVHVARDDDNPLHITEASFEFPRKLLRFGNIRTLTDEQKARFVQQLSKHSEATDDDDFDEEPGDDVEEDV